MIAQVLHAFAVGAHHGLDQPAVQEADQGLDRRIGEAIEQLEAGATEGVHLAIVAAGGARDDAVDDEGRRDRGVDAVTKREAHELERERHHQRHVDLERGAERDRERLDQQLLTPLDHRRQSQQRVRSAPGDRPLSLDDRDDDPDRGGSWQVIAEQSCDAAGDLQDRLELTAREVQAGARDQHLGLVLGAGAAQEQRIRQGLAAREVAVDGPAFALEAAQVEGEERLARPGLVAEGAQPEFTAASRDREGRRRARAPGRLQREVGELAALAELDDAGEPEAELVDHREEAILVHLAGAPAIAPVPADLQVHGDPGVGIERRVERLTHAVVGEAIGRTHALAQAHLRRREQRPGDLVAGAGIQQIGLREYVGDASGALEDAAGRGRQSLDAREQQVDDVGGDRERGGVREREGPRGGSGVEADDAGAVKRAEQLGDKIRAAAGARRNDLGQRHDLSDGQGDRGGDHRRDGCAGQRGQLDGRHPTPCGGRAQRLGEGGPDHALLDAARADAAQPGAPDLAEHREQELERRGVGGLEVVEEQHQRRLRGGERPHQGEHRAAQSVARRVAAELQLGRDAAPEQRTELGDQRDERVCGGPERAIEGPAPARDDIVGFGHQPAQQLAEGAAERGVGGFAAERVVFPCGE